MTTQSRPPKLRRRARLLGLLAGALAATALVPAGASAAQAPTNVWLQYQTDSTGVPAPFIFGGFSTEKKVCEHRTIDVFRSTDQMNWDYGWHSEVVDGPNPGLTRYLSKADKGYYYVLSVEKSTVVKASGKKVHCLPAMSEAVFAN